VSAHPINGTGRLLEVVTCRGCGTKGLEDSAVDPLAGYCPVCFEDLVAAAFGFDLGLTRPAEPTTDEESTT
jgi:hypothetical protein